MSVFSVKDSSLACELRFPWPVSCCSVEQAADPYYLLTTIVTCCPNLIGLRICPPHLECRRARHLSVTRLVRIDLFDNHLRYR